MPVYEYKCCSCGEVTELFLQSMKNYTKIINCYKCKGLANKMMSKSTFQLAGSGWGVTGYDKTKNEKDVK